MKDLKIGNKVRVAKYYNYATEPWLGRVGSILAFDCDITGAYFRALVRLEADSELVKSVDRMFLVEELELV